MVPIWKRSKSDVQQEEYNEFYKQTFHDFTDPAATFSIHAEGALSYDALLLSLIHILAFWRCAFASGSGFVRRRSSLPRTSAQAGCVFAMESPRKRDGVV